MKKLLALLLAALVASAALVACSNDKKSDKDDDDDDKSEVSSEVSSEVVSEGESSTGDVSTPDASTPDVSTPDVSTPDVSTPDVSTPDVEVPNDNSLVGTWVAEIDYLELGYGEPLVVEGETITLPACISLTFAESDLVLEISLLATVEEIAEAMVITDYIDYVEENGEIAIEDFLATLNRDDYLAFAEIMAAEPLVTDEVTYVFDGNTITYDNGEGTIATIEIDFSDDGFTITGCSDAYDVELLVGLTFVKQ